MVPSETGASAPTHATRSPGPLLVSLAAGAAGFAVNGFTLPVIPGVVLLFGSIFPLAVALALGPRYGLLAGGLAASRTVLLFGHPYALAGFAFEAAAVGWLAGRGWVPLFSSLAYWVLVGVPFLAAVEILAETANPAWRMILAKLLINEMLAVLLAEVLVWATALASRVPLPAFPRRPVRNELLRLFVPLFALPLCLVTLIQGTLQARRGLEAARTRLHEVAVAAGQDVDDYVNTHLRAIRTLAGGLEKAGPLDTRTIEPWLELTHGVYGSFLTMIVADRQGAVVAAHPTRDQADNPVVPSVANVADREYFKVPLASGKAFVSDVFLGRGFGRDPIVAISAPIRDQEGRMAGIAEGSLDLRALSAISGRYASLPETDVVIVDREDRVIHAGPHGWYAPLQDLRGSALTAAAAGPASSFLYGEKTHTGGGLVQYVAAWSRSDEGWRVFARQPLGVVQSAAERSFLVGAGLLLVGILASAAAARVAAGRATRPLEQLLDRLRSFSPVDVPAAPPNPAPPLGQAPAEVAELFDGFEAMAARLRSTLKGLLPICASCKRIRDPEGRWHRVEVYIHDHSEAEFTHGICPDCAVTLYPDLAKRK